MHSFTAFVSSYLWRNPSDWVRGLVSADGMNSVYLNVRQIANYFQVDPEQVHKWDREGKVVAEMKRIAMDRAIEQLPQGFPREEVRAVLGELKAGKTYQGPQFSIIREEAGRVILISEKTKQCWDLFQQSYLRDWRGKVNGQTVQVLPDGRRFNHLKMDRSNYFSGTWKTCKFAEEALSGHKVARLVFKFKETEEIDRKIYEVGRDIQMELQGTTAAVEMYGDVETKNKRGQPILVSYQRHCKLGDMLQYLYRHKMSPEEKIQIARSLLQGLCEMHNKQIYHRDIKEENILLDKNELTGEYDVRYCDFDLGWKKGGKLDQYCGTLHALAPERAKAWNDKKMKTMTEKDLEKNDIWGLGLVFYALYHGSCKYPAGILRKKPEESRQLLAEMAGRPGGAYPEPAEPFDHLIWKMLQIEPENRPTAKEVLAALEEIHPKVPPPVDLPRVSPPANLRTRIGQIKDRILGKWS